MRNIGKKESKIVVLVNGSNNYMLLNNLLLFLRIQTDNMVKTFNFFYPPSLRGFVLGGKLHDHCE